MTDKATIAAALAQAEAASRRELAANPQAATGSCTISSSGYSECKNDFTEDACSRQKAPGFTVKWRIGESC